VTFNSKKEAEDYVKSKGDWVYQNRYNGANEEVLRYSCKKSASCSSRWRIISKHGSPSTIVEQSDAEHDHEPKPERGTTQISKYNLNLLIIESFYKINFIK
jgi:hypothetical protein